MTAKVILFNGITKLDLPPERVLDAAKDGDLEGVLILGFTKTVDGGQRGDGLYMASSYADGGTVLWLLEMCKKRLLGMD